MVYYGNGRTRYELDTLLGSGGEGDVYRVKGKPDLVAKLYKPERLRRAGERDEMHAKLKAMLAIGLKTHVDGNLIVAWPKDTLKDGNGQFVGYVMPAVCNKASIICACRVREREQLFNGKYSWNMSVAMAYNLAFAVNHVHNAGIIIGDMNPNNVLVDANGLITLIDCDSFQITDGSGKVFRCEVGMEEMLPAELQGHSLSKPGHSYSMASDRFALAIHIFNLLCNGCHPFNCPGINEPSSSQSRSPKVKRIVRGVCPYVTGGSGKYPKEAPDMAMLPDYIRTLFDRVFKYDAKEAMAQATLNRRPTAAEWYNALARLYRGPMTRCRANPRHVYPAHYQAGCPWCAVEQRMKVPPRQVQVQVPTSTSTSPAPSPVPTPVPQPTPQKRVGTRYNRREVWPLYLMCILVGAIGAAYPMKYVAYELSAMTDIDWSVTFVGIVLALGGGGCGAYIAALAGDRYVTSNNGWPWMLLSVLGPIATWVILFLLVLAIYLLIMALAIAFVGAFACGACSGG